MMKRVKYRFYIGEGEKASDLIGHALSAEQHAGVYRDALIELYGACGLYFYSHAPGKPQGFVFHERKEIPGLKMGSATTENGFVYFPDMSTEEGRRASEALFDKRLEFDVEQMLLKHLSLRREVAGFCENCRNVHAKYTSHAFYLDGMAKIFVRVPVDDGPMPVPPDWLKEVKESEWLAAQGK